MRWSLACLIALALLTSCYRTHYVNFSPTNPLRSPTAGQAARHGREWQHFFLWGWVPSERQFDARAACGGAENIDSIRTQETFLEGLVSAFAGYYVNIYSPWNGAIYCNPPAARQPPAPPPPAPAPAP